MRKFRTILQQLKIYLKNLTTGLPFLSLINVILKCLMIYTSRFHIPLNFFMESVFPPYLRICSLIYKRERERNINWLPLKHTPSMCPDGESNLQPFCYMGWCSNQLSHLSRVWEVCFSNDEAAMVFKVGSVSCTWYKPDQRVPWLDACDVDTKGYQWAVLQVFMLSLDHSHAFLPSPTWGGGMCFQ